MRTIHYVVLCATTARAAGLPRCVDNALAVIAPLRGQRAHPLLLHHATVSSRPMPLLTASVHPILLRHVRLMSDPEPCMEELMTAQMRAWQRVQEAIENGHRMTGTVALGYVAAMTNPNCICNMEETMAERPPSSTA